MSLIEPMETYDLSSVIDFGLALAQQPIDESYLEKAIRLGHDRDEILRRHHVALPRLVAMHRGDALPTFDLLDMDALPPGVFDPRVLDQSTWWIDASRTPHRINDPASLSDRHLDAVMLFLVDWRGFAWQQWADATGVWRPPEIPPEGWLTSRPVFQALVREAVLRSSDGNPDVSFLGLNDEGASG